MRNKTQLEHFYSSHRAVADRYHAKAFIMITDLAHSDADNPEIKEPRYPKNSDYMTVWNNRKNYK